MVRRKKVPAQDKSTPATVDRVGSRTSDYDDIAVIREIMRRASLSKHNLYAPRETEWSRFTS